MKFDSLKPSAHGGRGPGGGGGGGVEGGVECNVTYEQKSDACLI
jgi:hypothetical protein